MAVRQWGIFAHDVGDFRHDVGDFRHDVGDFRPRGLSVGDFRHEDCPSVHISARWPFPWTVRVLIVRG